MNEKIAQQIKKSPQNPGIYIFKSKTGEFLYIGKASNLKNRLKQYSGPKINTPFLEHMLNEAEKIETKVTGSEIEALILESKLIKEKQPKFNIMLRDGKQYFYVVFTNEKFPKIFLTHQPSAASSEALVKEGPFTDGSALKTTLRLLRKIFPYCTCKQKHNNFCLNYHIGKCLGYCCLKNQESRIMNYELSEYKKNIKVIKDILNGKRDYLLKKLKKELSELAKEEKFEKAIKLRNQIERLEKIFANAKIIHNSKFIIHDSESSDESIAVLEELKRIFKLPRLPKRIEGYDISNIQGKNATGAMVVFIDGAPDKNEYRKFKIIFKKTPDDTAMLKEILARRLRHSEWPYPDLIFIDGGIAQLNIAIKTTAGRFPIISLAKGKKEIFSFTPYEAARARSTSLLCMGSTLKKPVPVKKLPNEIKNLILNIDSEAHRFAISYYRKLHRKAALPKTSFSGNL